MSEPTAQGIIKPKGLEGLKGLRGWNELSQEEQSSWLDLHQDIKPASPDKQAIAYRNNRYFDVLSPKEILSSNGDIATLDLMLRNKVITNTFNDYYGNDSSYDYLRGLEPESMLELMKSNYKNDEDFDNYLDSGYDEYVDKKVAEAQNAAVFQSMHHSGPIVWDDKDTWKNKQIKARNQALEKVVAKDGDRKEEVSKDEIDGLWNFYAEGQKAWGNIYNQFTEVVNGKGDLDDVIENMSLNRLITKQQADNLLNRPVEQKVNLVGEILAKSDFNPARVDTMWDEYALPRTVETQSLFGGEESYTLPGSRTYTALKDTDRFKNFSASDKLKEIATWQVLANKYGPSFAVTHLESDMAKYAHDNMTFEEDFADVYLNVLLGGVANIMNKVNAVGNIVTKVRYGDEGLANKLMGKNADGSERKTGSNVFQWFANNWDNPYYWSKVDQYNTLDPMEIAEADLNNGISIYTSVRVPDEPIKFFSKDTAKEALKMGKFVWSDYLVHNVLGGSVVKGATRALGEAAGKTTSLLNVFASGMGIAESYGVMTYEQAYQEMMQNLDKARQANAETKVKELLNSPEAQEQINDVVDRLMAEQRAANAGKEKPITISEDEIRRQVTNDFINYYTDKYSNDTESLASDEKLAREAATHAYVVDATIEELRMAVANFTFRKYLFDKGTRAALGDNVNYAKTGMVNGEHSIVNPRWQRAINTAKPFWGGFESNYFDDVTVGFGKGFGLGQYNAYLQNKYDPVKAADTTDNYTLNFISGLGEAITGAEEALTDRQSFYDGFIGALGTLTSWMPRFTTGEQISTMERMNVKEGDKLTAGQRINKYVMNPLLDAYWESVGKQTRTAHELPLVNEEVAKHSGAIESINQAIIGMNDVASSNLSNSIEERKDSKERAAFRLVYMLQGATTSPLIAQHPEVQKANAEIARLASGQITEEEVSDFLSQPGNKPLTSYADAREQARERIQKNAKSLQDMSKKISKANELLKRDMAYNNMDDDLKEQLIFQLAMDESWKERRSDMEKEISGKSNPATGHNAIAAYGSKEELERQMLAQMATISNINEGIKETRGLYEAVKERYKKMQEEKEKDSASHTDEELTKARDTVLSLQLQLQELGETQEVNRLKLKEMEKDSKRFKDEELPILSAEQIINLNPNDRATILNPKNIKNYSKEQQVEIKKATDDIRSRTSNANQLVEDSASLNTRIEDNKRAYSRLRENPEAATAYVESIRRSRGQQMERVFKERRVAEVYDKWNNTSSDEELRETVKEDLNSSTNSLRSYHIKKFLDKYPEKAGVVKGFYEVAKIREDAESALRDVVTSKENMDNLRGQMVVATNDSSTKEEAMSALEDLIDTQTDPVAKLQYDRVLEKLKALGHQRDATKVRNRELERKRRVEEENKRLEEEAKEKAKREGKNYGWDGYKVGDTVYNDAFTDGATVVGFEGSNTMVVEALYGDGTKGIYRYNSEKNKDSISKEKPAPIAPEGAVPVADVGEPLGQNPLDENVVQTGAVDVDIPIDDTGRVESPDAEVQAKGNGTAVEKVETHDTTDQGNNINTSSDGVISGTRLVEYSISSLKEGKVELEVPEKDTGLFSEFRAWLDNTHTKLQEIIDLEFGRMLVDNPDIEIKFMTIRSGDNTKALSKLLFNVVELTPQMREKYHDESRGGVIEANGKTWLVVGDTGFNKSDSVQQRAAWDTMRGSINKRALSYFNANTGEQYYVDNVAHSKVQNTTSGRIVNQRLGQEAPTLKRVSTLLKEAGRTLAKGEFGIQTRNLGEKSFATTSNVDRSKVKVFGPRNLEDNRGRTFILIDTPNGNKIPGMIEPAFLKDLREGSPLKDMIYSTISKLFDTNYEVRKENIKRLCGFLVLNDEKNILIGNKDSNVITITRRGVSDITQKLGESFDIAKFLSDLENANFQINITLPMLEDPFILQMYDESDALMTSVDSMQTSGMSYTIYMTDASGKPIMITPVGNAVPGTGEYTPKVYNSKMVNNVTYDFKEGSWVNRNNRERVGHGTSLEKSLIYNRAIDEGGRSPILTKNGKEYYDFQAKDGTVFVVSRDGLNNIEFLDAEETKKIQIEANRRLENKQREQNLKDVNFDETPEEAEATQAKEEGTLTQEQINQQAVGNFEAPAPEVKPQPTKEVVKEAKESKPTQTKEVIADIGTKPLTQLQNTEKSFTFVDVASNPAYMERLYEVLDEKGWEITGDFSKDAEILKQHNINVTNITDVDNWIDMIKNCR